MKIIYFLLLPLLLLSNPIDNIYIKSLHQKINTYVQKENILHEDVKNYILNNFDNNLTRKSIIIDENLSNDIFTNYANQKCDIVSSYCSETNGILLNITKNEIILKNSLAKYLNNVSNLITSIYNNNTFNKKNSYVLDLDRHYINDDNLKNAIILLNKIKLTNYKKYISKTTPITPTNLNDYIWFKPNGINGLDLYIYDGTKWIFNNTIGYNKDPYILNFNNTTLFNPNTFPGVINMIANVNIGGSIKQYIYLENKWVKKTLNDGTISSDISNILNLVTKDLVLVPNNKRNIKSNIFFNTIETVTKYGNDVNTSYWKNDNIILSGTFLNSISQIDNNQKYIFFPNNLKDNYIPMKKINGKFVYLSKTNDLKGVLEYPYNINENSKGSNIGNDITNTDHLILSGDTFNKQSFNNLMVYFQYNNVDHVFYSIKNYDNNTSNTNINLAKNQTSFKMNGNANIFYSLYANCNISTNLGDGICHNNGFFSGDKEYSLYKWYKINNKLYDSHKVISFSDMYQKNTNNLLNNLVLLNNNLFDLVLDTNGNYCYKKRLDNKYYTKNGEMLSLYDTNNKAILPINETCENVKLNNGLFVQEDIYDLLQNFNNAPNGTQVYIKNSNSIFTKVDDGTNNYWINIDNKIKVAQTRNQITDAIDPEYKFITLFLGNTTNKNDITQIYRYTNNGLTYKVNNKTLYEWFILNITKSINNLIDGKSFLTFILKMKLNFIQKYKVIIFIVIRMKQMIFILKMEQEYLMEKMDIKIIILKGYILLIIV